VSASFYVHMSRQNPRGQRSIRLKHGRVDPAWFDLDVDNGEDVDVTIFGLTAEELRQLGQGCARALAELVHLGEITYEDAAAPVPDPLL